MSENIRDTLKQRGAVYGDYRLGCETRNDIMMTIMKHYRKEHGENMNGLHMEYIWDIVNKITRLATTPTHIDSWRDIAGYATLVKDQLIKESPENAD